MSKKLIASRVFYSLQGMSKEAKVISHASGAMNVEDEEIFKVLLELAQSYNDDVVSIQVLCLSPLEFEEVNIKD